MAVGEQSGRFAETMQMVADVYERELDGRIKIATAIIPPIIVVIIASTWSGAVVFSIISAVFSVTNSIQVRIELLKPGAPMPFARLSRARIPRYGPAQKFFRAFDLSLPRFSECARDGWRHPATSTCSRRLMPPAGRSCGKNSAPRPRR